MSDIAVVDFDNDPPAQSAEFVRYLRDAAAQENAVQWVGRSNRAGLAQKLAHLPPPAEPLNPSDINGWREWQSSYRLGLLYRRVGPGFVIVQDRRPHRSKPARIAIGDSRLQTALSHCDSPVAFALAGLEKAIRFLAASDLVLIIGDHAVTLPYRLIAWPVPAYSV